MKVRPRSANAGGGLSLLNARGTVQHMVRVAITGGPGEGKSTVLARFAEAGLSVASSDVVAQSVFERPEIQAEIREALLLDGPATRDTVRSALAAQPSFRRRLNRIMHPAVRATMAASGAQVHEVPLLFEVGLQGHYDWIFVVTCGPEEQLRRLTERWGKPEIAVQMVASQLPSAAKVGLADAVLRTDRPLPSVLQDADMWSKTIATAQNALELSAILRP